MSYYFVAGGEAQTLAFQGLGGQTSCGMLIDDIHIESAIEASASEVVMSQSAPAATQHAATAKKQTKKAAGKKKKRKGKGKKKQSNKKSKKKSRK